MSSWSVRTPRRTIAGGSWEIPLSASKTIHRDFGTPSYSYRFLCLRLVRRVP